MNDWLDDLLADLPSEPCPPDLISRIQIGLAEDRKRSKRIQRTFRLAMVSAACMGLWLIVPRMKILILAVPTFSLRSLQVWFGALVRSPSDAMLDLMEGLISLVSQLAAGFEAELILALGLLAVPALYGVITMLSSAGLQEGVAA